MCQTGLKKIVADLSKQVGQWSGAEGSAGQLLPSPHLPCVPEGGAVDDLSPVAPSVQPGVQSAQRRLPLYAPFSLPGLLRRLGWGVSSRSGFRLPGGLWRTSSHAPLRCYCRHLCFRCLTPPPVRWPVPPRAGWRPAARRGTGWLASHCSLEHQGRPPSLTAIHEPPVRHHTHAEDIQILESCYLTFKHLLAELCVIAADIYMKTLLSVATLHLLFTSNLRERGGETFASCGESNCAVASHGDPLKWNLTHDIHFTFVYVWGFFLTSCYNPQRSSKEIT